MVFEEWRVKITGGGSVGAFVSEINSMSDSELSLHCIGKASQRIGSMWQRSSSDFGLRKDQGSSEEAVKKQRHYF